MDLRLFVSAAPVRYGQLLGGSLLALALSVIWYVYVSSPAALIDRDRAATVDAVEYLRALIPAPGDAAETEARALVVAVRSVLPRLEAMGHLELSGLKRSTRSLENALRLGTFEIRLYRSTLEELWRLQSDVLANAQRLDERHGEISQRLSIGLYLAIGLVVGVVGWSRVNRRRGALLSVLGKEELGQLLFEVSPEAVSIADSDERIVAVNPAYCRVTGFAADEVLGQPLGFNGSGEQDDQFFHAVAGELQERGQWTGEIWQRRKNGEAYAEKVTRVRINDEVGRASGFLTVAMDLTANSDATQLINWQAQHDTLTKLPNRGLLQERLRRVLTNARREASGGALVSVDVDRFKRINDAVGPQFGDRLLIELAMRIAMCVRETDTVARLGSDEFAVVLPDATSTEADRISRAILEAISAPVLIDDSEIFVSASAGAAMFPRDGDEPGVLMQKADTAMAQAKAQGGDTLVFFEAKMNAHAERRAQIETALRRALIDDQMVLFYQPVIDQQSNALIGAEALIRWQHPEWGTVSPGEFIPIAEDSGLIVDIGRWTVAQVSRQVTEWSNHGLDDLRVSLNLSGRELRRDEDRQALLELFAQGPAARMTVEITESVLMDDADAVKTFLDHLRGLGVRVALDDFGTGFSSLGYLRQFSFDVLKIDRSFIQHLSQDNADLALVAAIVSMGRILGLDVVAEGVETQAQLSCLEDMGCNLIQGFFFARPMPADEFVAFARNH